MFLFPDPIAFSIGPYSIKWYGLAYVFGIILAWVYGRTCIRLGRFSKIGLGDWDGAINSMMLGVVIGGRLGYFALYSPETFWRDPLEIIQIWRPGMAFHGGLIGVIGAVFIYAHLRSLHPWVLMDIAAVSAPIGLFLGRLANFVNQEHCGYLTNMPWGVVFPTLPDGPRHPSQLYEAGLEGIGLFLILKALMRSNHAGYPGQLSGIFLIGYGVMRIISELFRMPDGIWKGLTLGQWYCNPCIIAGCILYFWPSKAWSSL
jgi:phosphatidylglycerol:prolipoprotein diacylglycerol transferase